MHLNRYIAPHFLSFHGAFQALWNVYGAKDKHIPLLYHRDLIRLKDGGTVSIDWAYPPEEN